METLPTEFLTPFTDFRVEDCDGVPRAVFDRLPPEQSALLAHFLHPDRNYIGALYLDVLKVARKKITWLSYEDDYFKVTCKPKSVVLETKGPVELAGRRVRLRLPTGDVMLLLMRWGLRCVTWVPTQRCGTLAMRTASTSHRVSAHEPSFEKKRMGEVPG